MWSRHKTSVFSLFEQLYVVNQRERRGEGRGGGRGERGRDIQRDRDRQRERKDLPVQSSVCYV